MTAAVELSESIALESKIAEENPDLSYDFIKSILIAHQEALAGQLEPYKPGAKQRLWRFYKLLLLKNK